MHGVLQKVLDQASSDSLIPRDAAKGVRCEARALLAAARGDRLEALYVPAVSTGLREGELLALRREDVDLEGAMLRVSQTLTRDGGKVAVGPPKTKNSAAVPVRGIHGRRRGGPQRAPDAAARGDGARRCVSTTSGTRAPHCCCRVKSTPSSSPRCSGTRPQPSLLTPTPTCSPTCSRAPSAPSKKPSSNAPQRVAARLLHRGPGTFPGPLATLHLCAAKQHIF